MGEDDPDLGVAGRLRLESGVPDATRKRLAEIGWQLGNPDGGFGRYECVEHRMDGDTRVYAAASEAFWFASKENIQTHGGIGFTWEADPQLYYRRSRQLSLVAGAPATWRERLVSQLEMKNAA